MPNSDAVNILTRDLRDIFGDRLRSLVAYAVNDHPPDKLAPTLAVVETLTVDDLRACAARAERWQQAGLRTPLLLQAGEFEQSLDAFPFEFGAILADHVVVSGANPFDGVRVDPADLRRACELQARSHLLHLREEYIETGGESDAVARLIRHSAPALAALLKNVKRVNSAYVPDPTLVVVAGLDDRTHFTTDDARRVFPSYLGAIETLAQHVDRWSTS